MDIKEISVTKIRRDPHQPRTSFDENEIEDIAQSIKTVGVINPIEVDTEYVIITGERRWRAAKEAGLKTIPVKILKISKEDRYMRQVIENTHHDTRSEWDVAKSLEKLLLTAEGDTRGEKIAWLASKIGKGRLYIYEKTFLLETSRRFQKEVREGKIVPAYARILHRAPQEFRAQLEKKILAREFPSHQAGIEVALALTRDPTQAKKLLAVDYSKLKTSREVTNTVMKIVPSMTESVKGALKPANKLGEIVTQLLEWLDNNSPDTVGRHNLHRVVVNLQTADKEMGKWLKVKRLT